MDFLGDLPGWAQLLISVASIGGGAWGGGFAAALARVRLDDRRRLLDELSGLSAMLTHASGQERTWAYTQMDQTGEEEWEWFTGQGEQIERITELVRLLPWRDRWAWGLVAAAIPPEWKQSIRATSDYRAFMVAPYPPEPEKIRILSEGGFQNRNLPVLQLESRFGWITAEFGPKMDQLVEFQQRRVNPRRLSFYRAKHTSRLVWARLGQRLWPVPIIG